MKINREFRYLEGEREWGKEIKRGMTMNKAYY